MVNVTLLKMFKKWTLFFIGITLLSLGITIMIWAKALGVSPWDVFHLGLVYHSSLNYGQVIQGIGLIVIVLSLFLGVKPGLGTVLNMLVIGWEVNFFLAHPFVPLPHNLWSLFLYLILGTAFIGVGTGLYIGANTGAGPRDSLMIGFQKKFGWPVGRARTILELLVLFIGYLLSGPVGIGTLIYSLTIGFFVEKTIRVFEWVKSVKNSEL